ncbi:MAG: hypothetical protein DDT19_00091 [Syntrophomonadaceae bacterium]|nr:hypothetical protein [Bacillota bacterium]
MLKQILIHQGINVVDLARRTGIHRHTLYNIINHRTDNPHASTKKQIADVLNLPIEIIFPNLKKKTNIRTTVPPNAPELRRSHENG